ncbi:hypothetical protein [Nocardia sp. NPDC049149]|uniref:hypothetical protein n=1 Tax=Nocardia sp. NPDC049149 TaxID=3364315 RepID=UPI0037195E7B
MTEIRHGYTLQQVDILVRCGVLRNPWYQGIDADERYATGWHAAVELLYVSEQQPTPRDLTHAAWYAADKWTGRSAEEHGVPRARGESYQGRDDMPRFHAYWSRRTIGAVDEAVVDRVALLQIWPRLKPIHQEALQALAAYEDYRQAADALGLRYHTFCARVRLGRNRFHELWLEGETPNRRWRDRRISMPGGQRISLSAHVRKRRRSGIADAVGVGKTSNTICSIEGATS